ncbi:MAG: cobyric acid synthase [Oligoflexia bacterium]|nr:cobyric acid synthase [Oligoflexia bacterium]
MNDNNLTLGSTSGAHGGEVYKLARELNCESKEILDFSANINPLGFPEWIRADINRSISDIIHYPDRNYFELKSSIASYYNLKIENIVVLNGVAEFLAFAPYIDFLANRIPITLAPSFSLYTRSWKNLEIVFLEEENDFLVNIDIWEKIKGKINLIGEERSVIYLANPNNPTGKCLDILQLKNFCNKYPQAIFIIDEAFIDFVDANNNVDLLKSSFENVIVLRSLTKILAIPSLRLGFLVTNSSYAKDIEKVLPIWNVNSLAANLGCRFYKDRKNCTDIESDFCVQTQKEVKKLREELVFQLLQLQESCDLKIKIFEGEANFILLKFIDRSQDEVKEIINKLLIGYHIAVRDTSNFLGLSSSAFIRIAVKGQEENIKLIEAFTSIFEVEKRSAINLSNKNSSKNKSKNKNKSKYKPIMLAGTGSSVGKSILTAGLARIFYQDGIQVVPFKAQNMSLNSFVTINEEEIGRAQGLQAQAAGVVADARMNPILLKPNSDNGSQVILNGKPIANMHYSRYMAFKEEAFIHVKQAYDSLREEYDLIVMEGAGSISEINLKQNDLVNMNMAKYANASVYLVGDIDRGGVFGQFVGTITTLTEWEKKLIKGFIINRFRGIESLLKSGIDYLENICSVPVIGVVPYLKDLLLPDEDSLEFSSGKFHDDSLLKERIDIAVIDLPKISNFTDLDPFRHEADVRLRVVKNAEELATPDLIIIPGSKNVLADYKELCSRGLDKAIKSLFSNNNNNNNNTVIFGICGGYQMLGKKITDPYHIESSAGEINTLGLLPITTVLEKEKTLVQTKGIHQKSNLKVSGYEIHHGKSKIIGECNTTITKVNANNANNANDDILAISSLDKKVHGTYLHGVFDEDEFRRFFLDQIHISKGRLPIKKVNHCYSVEKSLDLLALHLRKTLNVKRIYEDMKI